MLRPLYRCVLRLHPPGFRKRFGGEMLSIFDQAQGKLDHSRLLLDGLVSVTRQWTARQEFWAETPARSAKPTPTGAPLFISLDPFRPRSAAVIHGALLSIALFCLTCFAIRYSWIHILHVRIPEVQFETPQWIPPSLSSSNDRSQLIEPSPGKNHLTTTASTAPPGRRRARLNAPAQSDSVAKASTSHASRPAKREASQPREVMQTEAEAKQQVRTALSPVNGDAGAVYEGPPLDVADRHRVIDGAIADLNKYYVDPDLAQKVSVSLRAHEKNGDYNRINDGKAFAELLTTQMRDVSDDQYLEMSYSGSGTPLNPPAPSSEDIARYRRDMQRLNCGFEKVEILPHNIGYLKLNSFPDTSICAPIAKAAMAKLNHVDAIIFDLRDNPGGYANMVELLAAYLFSGPRHLNDFYDRGENSTEESWSLPAIAGNKLADKPAFVLTSHTTFSAAEAFSYDLKIMKRATLVGETTSGRGHMGAPYRIDDRFTIRIPNIKVTNPVSGTNWQGTGVEPDVKVSTTDALKTAIRLAEATLQKSGTTLPAHP